MTADEVVQKILSLRDVTRATGCMTRRAQSQLLASLPDDLLLEVACRLAPILKKDTDRETGTDRINYPTR